jgi:hypothetical protein
MNTYLHNAQPPNPVTSDVATRIDRVNSAKGSAPSILPAAIALLLYAKQLSLCCLFSQYRQNQDPSGFAYKLTHSAKDRREEIQHYRNENQKMQLCSKGLFTKTNI